MSKRYRMALCILCLMLVIFVITPSCHAQTQQEEVDIIFENAISVNDLNLNTRDDNVTVSIDNCVVTLDQAYKSDSHSRSSVKIDFNELIISSLEEKEYPSRGHEIIIHGDPGSVEISGTDGEHGSYNTMIIVYNERQERIDEAIKYFTSTICTGKH